MTRALHALLLAVGVLLAVGAGVAAAVVVSVATTSFEPTPPADVGPVGAP